MTVLHGSNRNPNLDPRVFENEGDAKYALLKINLNITWYENGHFAQTFIHLETNLKKNLNFLCRGFRFVLLKSHFESVH